MKLPAEPLPDIPTQFRLPTEPSVFNDKTDLVVPFCFSPRTPRILCVLSGQKLLYGKTPQIRPRPRSSINLRPGAAPKAYSQHLWKGGLDDVNSGIRYMDQGEKESMRQL